MSLWFTASALSPLLQSLWSLSSDQAAALTTAVQVGFVVGTALAAISNLPDLLPSRTYFAVCCVLAAVANGVLVWAPGYGTALACRFLTGFFLAGVYPPAMKMIATWFKSGRGLAIGTVVGALTIGKRMPEMIDVMVERLQSDEVDPAVQCAVATVLAYVVQPRDLIPDDAPGGYGFIDDTILLHAGFLDVLSMEPPRAEQFRTQQEFLSFISSFAPPPVMAELQRTVENMEMTLSVFRMLPREALEVTTSIIIDEPLRVSTMPIRQDGQFHSSHFLEHAGEGVDQHLRHDGDKLVLQYPGGEIASDGENIYGVRAEV